MSERRAYPNAPVVLVAIEIRHPVAEELSKRSLMALKRHVASRCPLAIPASGVSITATASGIQQVPYTWPRYVSRDKATAVTFRDGAIVVETMRYGQYETLRDLVQMAVEGRQQFAPVDGVERIGMRYINEVRVPELRSLADWLEWVAPSLSGPASIAQPDEQELSAWQGVTVFGSQDASGSIVRHGAYEGYAVSPSGDLNRPTPPPGPFFLIDIDSYWVPEGETPDLKPDNAMTHLDDLNLAAKGLFEGLITDRLRNEVLRVER